MKTIEGVFTAMVTCFAEDGSLDIAAMRESTRFQIASGVGGLCPLGGTGEPLSMSVAEHCRVVDAVVSEAGGRIPIIVGCLLGNQNDIITVGRHSRQAGADAIMVIPPYFIVTRLSHIRRHFETIADECDMPMVLFNGPSRSGVRLDAETILGLIAEIPKFVAIKETSGDLTVAGELLRSAPPAFRVLQGFDELVLPTLALGGHGAVLSLGCLLPNLLRRLSEAYYARDLSTAQRIQLKLLPLCRAIYREPNPSPLKLSLILAGRSAGPTRRPIYGPSETTCEELRKILPDILEDERRSGRDRNAA